MKSLVHIIVLNWNNWQDTAACLESCQRLNYENFKILMIDNGSRDNSESILRKQFPTIEIIQTGKNLGFSGGNNVGIRRALEKGTDFVWLLNNDTIVDPQCLTQMVQSAEADQRIGMIGGKIFYHHSPEALWFAGGQIDLDKGGVTRHIGQDEKDRGGYDQLRETDYITGCSVLVRREMIDDIGLLDEDYFLYFEDADWSLRARKKGWRLLYQPEAILWHKEGAQSEKVYSARFIYYFLRNRFFFMDRFAPHKKLRCHLLQFKTALFFIKQAFGRSIGAGFKTSGLVLSAYRDYFIRHKMGFKQGL